MSDLDATREAVEHNLEPTIAELIGPSSTALYARTRAAARKFLALTETGPDYEAAQQVVFYIGGEPVVLTPPVAKRVVDAALADYLTEEETE